jgi:uncharacterized protein YegP (UPF0339 family)
MYFEIYKDTADGWRWRLKVGNGRIIGDSGESYVTKANAERAARQFRGAVGGAEIRLPRTARKVRPAGRVAHPAPAQSLLAAPLAETYRR